MSGASFKVRSRSWTSGISGLRGPSECSGVRGARGVRVGELVRAHPPDEFPVEPIEPLEVRDGRARLDLAQVEGRYQLLHREDVLFGTGRPSEEGDEVVDGLGQIAGFAVLEDVFGAVPFGQGFLIRPED